jgi:hypothetical protein
MLPVFALGGFGGVWDLVMVGLNQEKTISSVWSQDRHYRASIMQSFAQGGCGNPSSLVVVERRNFFFKTGEFTPFCFDGAPDRISLSWKDPETLAVECSGCGENYGYTNQNWGKLHFAYDLDKP